MHAKIWRATKARALADKYHKPGFGGSDAHRPDCIGLAYTMIPDRIKTESQFIAFVKKDLVLGAAEVTTGYHKRQAR